MQLKTILNRVQKHQGVVYAAIEWTQEAGQPALTVAIRPRANGRPICSGCGRKRPGYDTQKTPRRFEFIPFWGILVYFVYAMRRVDCPTCGVKVEQVPWAQGKRTVTTTYAWFLARWPNASVGPRWPRRFTPAGIRCTVRWRSPSLGGVRIRIWIGLRRSASTNCAGGVGIAM